MRHECVLVRNQRIEAWHGDRLPLVSSATPQLFDKMCSACDRKKAGTIQLGELA